MRVLKWTLGWALERILLIDIHGVIHSD
jgi:hypothetical protein